jgi:cell division protein FtsI/penicillin-binding protein 2
MQFLCKQPGKKKNKREIKNCLSESHNLNITQALIYSCNFQKYEIPARFLSRGKIKKG